MYPRSARGLATTLPPLVNSPAGAQRLSRSMAAGGEQGSLERSRADKGSFSRSVAVGEEVCSSSPHS